MNTQIRISRNILGLVLFLSTLVQGQEFKPMELDQIPEKIYLQLTSNVFTNDETIWFKSIVTKADFHETFEVSGVAYVELINADQEVVDRKTLKLLNGIGSGFFELNSNYANGTYLIRAYTEWSKNFDSDFMFQEYVQIFTPKEVDKVEPISNIVVEENIDNSRLLSATVDPFVIDSLHKKKVIVYFTTEDRKDSLTLKERDDGSYSFEHRLSKDTQVLSLRFKTRNTKSATKTIVIDQNYLDVQFFPESGELVHGIPSKVGFKSIDVNGKGRKVQGVIVNDKDEKITSFQSNQLGMGSFVLPEVDSSAQYFAKISPLSDKEMQLKYPLPRANAIGNVLSIHKVNKGFAIEVFSNYMDNDSIYIRMSCRGVDYYEIKGRLKNGELKYNFSEDKLPEGIIAIKLSDKNKIPLAERLYFNKRSKDPIQVSIIPTKNTYEQRELTTLSLQTSNDEGAPLLVNTSVLVINKDQMGEMQSSRQNIASYFLLDSDLKGTIENPGYYFQKGQNRFEELDHLLLTQGWRKYNYAQPIKDVKHPREDHLSISGEVVALLSSKKKKEVKLTLATLGDPKTFDTQLTDSLGRFTFELEDSFRERLNILLSTKKDGKQKSYTVTLDEKESPIINFEPIKSIVNVDSVIHAYLDNNGERNRITQMFEMTSDINQLDEVEITAYKMTPQRAKVQKEHGDPDIVIKGKEIQAKEEKWSYGLYSVIMFHYPDKIRVIQVGSNLYAQVIGSPSTKPGNGVTLVLVDGIPVMKENYPLISSIPPSEVSSFEIIKSATGFFKLFMQVFPRVHPLEAPKFGSVIAIYTHAGKGLHGVHKPVGLMNTSIPVFSPVREFYKPKYDNLSPSDWLKPDLRALVHWEPQLISDHSGNASVSFYNGDTTGAIQVIVEAISENGDVGYQELTYQVEKVAKKE